MKRSLFFHRKGTLRCQEDNRRGLQGICFPPSLFAQRLPKVTNSQDYTGRRDAEEHLTNSCPSCISFSLLGLNHLWGRQQAGSGPGKAAMQLRDRQIWGSQRPLKKTLTGGSWRAVTCCASLKLASWRREVSCRTERDQKWIAHKILGLFFHL